MVFTDRIEKLLASLTEKTNFKVDSLLQKPDAPNVPGLQMKRIDIFPWLSTSLSYKD